MKCISCGFEMEKGARFCSECGAEQPVQTDRSVESVADAPRGFSNKIKISVIAAAAAVLLAGVPTVIAVTNSQNRSESSLTLAERYLSENKYEQAIIEFQKMLDIDQMNVDAYLGMSEAYLALGDTGKALETLRMGYEITGDDVFLRKLSELGVASETQELPQGQTQRDEDISSVPADFRIDISETVKHTICYVDECDFAVAIREDGTVITDGSNCYGECATEGWTDIVSVSADATPFTVGLRADGTVVAVGNNDPAYGIRGCNVDGWTDIVDICSGNGQTYGLRSDGSIVSTRDDDRYSDLRGITDIEIVNSKLMCLRYDGTIEGSTLPSDYDELRTLDDVKQVAGTVTCIAALLADGTVRIDGADADMFSDATGWTDIVEIAAGSNHLAGLRSDGTVVAAGEDLYGYCDVSEWTDIVQITCGTNSTIGVRADGTVIAAGDDINLCDWSDVEQLVGDAEFGYNSFAGLKSDGTVAALDLYHHGEQDFREWTDIEKLTLSCGILYGMTSDGRIRLSECSSSGLSDEEKAWFYLQENVADVSRYGYCLHNDGSIIEFGDNSSDSSGIIFPSGDYYRQKIVDEWSERLDGEIYDVARNAMNDQTYILMTDGRVYSIEDLWDSEVHELIETDAVEIAIGSTNPLLILHKDRTVSVYGENSSEFAALVDGWTDIVHIASSGHFYAALTADGRLLTSESGRTVYNWTGIKLH